MAQQKTVDDTPTRLRGPCPQLNFSNFAAVANAALGTTLSPPFDVFADDVTFLLGCFIIEDFSAHVSYHVRTEPLLQTQHVVVVRQLNTRHVNSSSSCLLSCWLTDVMT